jgi:protein-S-isoprenylcysteine O-methyltransferase Ste14
MSSPLPSAGPPPMLRSALALLSLVLLVPVLLFATAGTVAWPMAWAYIALSTLGTAASRLAVARTNPDTLAERARGFQAEGVQSWDLWLLPVVLWSSVLILAVAGLDHRFGWSTLGSARCQVAAFLPAAAGYAITTSAMVANRFFSGTVRIQTDRGHTVVSSGPYRLVRHPGYAGSVLATVCVPVILGSWWAFVPAGVAITALIVRTALEDRMLRSKLEGYAAFTEQTRYRLIPGVW